VSGAAADATGAATAVAASVAVSIVYLRSSRMVCKVQFQGMV
jgi:hypothetical protein